ncbi:MAG: carboxypeptidase regulatory-like domain-containing protein [Archangiaceae bacterium]|nr:carboxypeptidase regulatory-like domain-containing protein [Archangiaceae bacterium]
MNRTIALFTAALVACSPPATDANKDGIADGVRTPNTVTQVAPSNPVGTITGVVANTKFVGLADVSVLLVLGSGFTSAIKSSAEGAFRFANVPAGSSGQLIVSKEGFGSVRVPVTVPVSGGNVPVNDANANAGVIMLLELNGSVKYQVQTANGRPAKAVKAFLEVSPAGFQLTSGTGYGTSLGQLSFEGTADDTGALTFMNGPAPTELARTTGGQTNYTLVIAGLDEDGDGENEFNGLVDSRSGRDFFTTGVPTLRLPDNRAGGAPAIVATNVESLTGTLSPVRNLLRPTESVYVVFNQPIAERSLLVRATQEDCSTVVNTSVVVKGNVLQISAAGNGWTIGDKHNLLIRATGTEAGGSTQTASFTGFVFGGELATPKAPTSAAFSIKRSAGNMTNDIQNGDTLIITFDVPLRRVSTSGFFQWNFDLNMMGGVNAMDFGEFGSSGGFSFSPDEPTIDPLTSQFSCLSSNYTRRWTGTISSLPVTGIPRGTQARVVLPVVGAGQGGYQTIWGVAFTGPQTGVPTVLP